MDNIGSILGDGKGEPVALLIVISCEYDGSKILDDPIADNSIFLDWG